VRPFGYRFGTSSSVLHGDNRVDNIRGGGFMDRLAAGMSDYGYGGGEEAKRAALQRALSALGVRMLAGATKEGAGAIAPAVGEAFGAYQGGLEEQREQRRKEDSDRLVAEQYQRQRDLADAQIENYRDDNVRASEAAQEKLRQRAAEVARQREIVAKLPPDQATLLEPSVGNEKFDERLWEITKPKEPKDVGFTLGEGQVRYDAAGKIIASGPPKSAGAGDKPWAGIDYVARGDQLVKINKATGKVEPVFEFSGTGADPAPQRRAITTDLYKQILENWNPEAYPEYIKKGTQDAPDPKKIWDGAWGFAGRYVGGKESAPPPPVRKPAQKLADIESVLGRKLPAAVRKAVLEDLARGMLPRDIVAELQKDLR
jgi:hypothetical protein